MLAVFQIVRHSQMERFVCEQNVAHFQKLVRCGGSGPSCAQRLAKVAVFDPRAA